VKNPFAYTQIPENDLESDSTFGGDSQATSIIFKDDQNQYYKERVDEVQHIEKTMGDINSMFTRLTNAVFEQRFYIERFVNFN